jgi:hypothetical protein
MSEDIISKETKKKIAALFEVAREDFRNIEHNRKERLLKLAKDMDDSKFPKDMICTEICKAIADKDISENYIQRNLPKEYKRKYDKDLEKMQPHNIADNKPIEQLSDGSQQIGETKLNDAFKEDNTVPSKQLEKQSQMIKELEEKNKQVKREELLKSQQQEAEIKKLKDELQKQNEKEKPAQRQEESKSVESKLEQSNEEIQIVKKENADLKKQIQTLFLQTSASYRFPNLSKLEKSTFTSSFENASSRVYIFHWDRPTLEKVKDVTKIE